MLSHGLWKGRNGNEPQNSYLKSHEIIVKSEHWRITVVLQLHFSSQFSFKDSLKQHGISPVRQLGVTTKHVHVIFPLSVHPSTMAKMVVGERGGLILVWNGYRYQRHRLNENTINWRCWRRGTCQARLRTQRFDIDHAGDVNPVIFYQDEHAHGPEEVMITRADVRETIRGDVMENPTVPIRRVYDATAARIQRQPRPLQGGGDRPIDAYYTFRSILNRARVSQLPAIPGNIEDVIIEGQWARTWLDERFLLYLDNEWGIAMFGSNASLTALQQCREVYMDGTFRTCPRPYAQFFTIHGRYRGWVLPFIMVLMTNRGIGHYRQLLQVLKRQVRLVSHHRWRPQIVVADFEQALIIAVETELTANIRGCYFHFTQSLWRRVQNLGLVAAYRQDDRLKKCIRKVMAIGYLPVALMQMNFNLLRTDRRTVRLINRYPALMDFFDYVQNTYVNGTFPPALWNVYDRDMETRTNNVVESKYKIMVSGHLPPDIPLGHLPPPPRLLPP